MHPPDATTSPPVPAAPIPSRAPHPGAARTARARGGSRRGFRPDIEGMRAIAVLLVVLFHAGVPWVGGGFVGVDVFFVISGYLITGLLVAELLATGRIDIPSFYLRRARRLLPALALVVVATMLAARVLAPFEASGIARDGVWASIYLVNAHFIAGSLDYFAADLPDSPLLHIWSLAIEEQFYLAWPAALLLVGLAARRRGIHPSLPAVAGLAVVVGGASLVGSVMLTPARPELAYFLPFTRVWELLAGALLAVLHARPRGAGAAIERRLAPVLAWAGIAAIVLAGVAYSDGTPFPGSAALLPVVGTMLVIAHAPASRRLQVALSRPTLQWIGLRSYALYLWHWPLLVLVADAGSDAQRGGASAAAVAASAVLAAVTFRLVENPVRRAPLLLRSRRASIVVALALTLGPVLLGLVLLRMPVELAGAGAARGTVRLEGGDADLDRLRRELAASTDIVAAPVDMRPPLEGSTSDEERTRRQERCNVATAAGNTRARGCDFGLAGGTTTMLVWGDSHAGHWRDAFEAIADERGWAGLRFARGLCPSLSLDPDTLPRNLVTADMESCDAWRDTVLKRIGIQHPELVVLSNKHTYCSEVACPGAYAATVRAIAEVSPSTVVVALEDTPMPQQHMGICVAEHLDDIRPCGQERSAVDAQPRAAFREEVEAAGATWISTTDWFCTREHCPPTLGNVRLYRDRTHITQEAARLLAPVLGWQVDRALQEGGAGSGTGVSAAR